MKIGKNAPCPCGSGKVYRKCCLEKFLAQRAHLDTARVAHQSVDGVLRVLLPLVESRGEFRVACHEGCAHCCVQFIRTSFTEALLIADWLLRPAQAELLRRFEARLDEWRDQVGPELDELDDILAEVTRRPDPDAVVPRYIAAASAHDARGVPCPFLDGENRCEIYTRRPVPCRAYFALDTSERCRVGSPEAPATLRHPSLQGVVGDVRKLLDDEGRKLDGQPSDRALPLAVSDALAYLRALPEEARA